VVRVVAARPALVPVATKVLALDAALWCSGFALLHDGELFTGGSIRPRGKDRARALAFLWRCVSCLCEAYRPTAIVIERPGGWTRASNRSSQATVEALAQARGVVWAVAGMKGIPCHEMAVMEARGRVVCSLPGWKVPAGRGGTKEQAQFAVRALGYPMVIKAGEVDGDYVDAVVLGLAYLSQIADERAGRGQR
jgi:Holliday junction resolvasome RuvABC endonuclease subunit